MKLLNIPLRVVLFFAVCIPSPFVSAVSLEALMDSSSPGTSVESGSLLGDIEEERNARIVNELRGENTKLQQDIQQSCNCLHRGDCQKTWVGSGDWDFSNKFVLSIRNAVREKQEICLTALTNAESGPTSTENLQAANQQAKQTKQLLKNIDFNLGSAATRDLLAARKRKRIAEEQHQDELAKAHHRKLQAEEAVAAAELAAEWANFGKATTQDNFQQIQDQTMEKIYSNQKAQNQAQQQSSADSQQTSLSYTEALARICTNKGGRFDYGNNYCKIESKKESSGISDYEAEKQNCLNAGKTWNDGCDYANDVKISGWTQGNIVTVVTSDSAISGSETQQNQNASAVNTGSSNDSIQSTSPSEEMIDTSTTTKTMAPTKKAWAYCWRTKSGNYICDGPTQLVPSALSTLRRALEQSGCSNGRHTDSNWYDCGRELETSHEKDVKTERQNG